MQMHGFPSLNTAYLERKNQSFKCSEVSKLTDLFIPMSKLGQDFPIRGSAGYALTAVIANYCHL